MLADGLELVNAVKDMRTALHDQAKRALQNGRSSARLRALGRPRRAPLARRERRDCRAAPASASPTTLSWKSRQCARQAGGARAKARDFRVSRDLIVSRCSGVSLVRIENAHVRVRGRVENLHDLSPRHSRHSKEGTTMNTSVIMITTAITPSAAITKRQRGAVAPAPAAGGALTSLAALGNDAHRR